MPKSAVIVLFASLLLFFSCGKVTVTCSDESLTCSQTGISYDSTLNRKVLIIGIDGFRSDALQEELAPFMYQLSQDTSTFFTDKNTVEDLTFSGPNWASLLNGVHWCRHNVTSNDFEGHLLEEYPSVFHYVESAAPHLNTVSIVNWTPLNTFLTGPDADYAPETEISDAQVHAAGIDLLQNKNPLDPDLAFIAFDDLDSAGHNSGFHPEKEGYANTLTRIDGYVADLFDLIETRRTNGENWLVLIISDHGGAGKGHTGRQNNDHVNKTIFFANSPEVSFLQEYTSSQVDVAPTLLQYMGVSSQAFDCKTDGISVIVN